MSDLIHQVIAWVGAHPHWAGLVVLAVACAESLAIVGLAVPGATMMFAAGALIAVGAMNFWTTLVLAVVGAVLGDGVSYWLGYRYNQRIRQWWPFSRYRFLQSRALPWAPKWLNWGRTYPVLAWIIGDLLDAEKPASRALLLWLGILFGATWLFLGVLEDVVTGDPLVLAGQALYELLQGLRTPVGDHIMVAFSELGDGTVVMTLVVVGLLWMGWKRAWREALYWLAVAGFAALAVAVFKYTLHFPRPVDLYSGVDSYSFPSGHATLSTVVYGYLAILSAHAFPVRWRWTPYAVATLLITGIAFSRLYLGAHWLADVAAGVGLGTAWIALLVIARHYHLRDANLRDAKGIDGLPTVVLLAFFVVGGWHIYARMAEDLARYAVQHPVYPMSAQAWWQKERDIVPALRIDLEGEQKQPLNIQWAGELSQLRQTLQDKGWHVPTPLTLTSGLSWLAPNPSLDQLPVLPQLHNGQFESLLLSRADPAQTTSQAQRLVLRLWRSNVRLGPGNVRLWIGTISSLRLQCLPLICFPRSTADYDRALTELEPMLSVVEWQRVNHALMENGEQQRIKSALLLIR